MDDIRLSPAPMNVTSSAVLAEWVAGVDLAAVPADVLDQAKACLIDSIGCIVAGSAARPCRILLDVLSRHAGTGDIAVPGTGRALGLLGAAHMTAQAANALDFDDSYRSGAPSHPGATVVPPALALAQERASHGSDLLRAVLAGYEVSLRIGRAVQPTPERKRQVYGLSTWQVFGAVVSAAALLRLPVGKFVDAFGIAAVHAPVPSLRKLGTEDPRPYPWTKNTYGQASEAGLLGALLAAEGYIGSRSIFDGERGFWVMSGSDRYRPELLTEDLGGTWLIRDVGFKSYGCCRWTHTMIDAARSLSGEVDPAKIEAVEVICFEELSRLTGGAPTSTVDAQFNAPHLAALELLGRSAENGLFERDLTDESVAALRARVTMRHNPAADEAYYATGSLPVRVVLHLVDGSTREASRHDPTGSAARGGYSVAEMDKKFLTLASGPLGPARARAALAVLRDIENRPVADLVAQIA